MRRINSRLALACWAATALVLPAVGCEEDSKAGAAPQEGDRGGGAGKPSVSSNGSDMPLTDGGTAVSDAGSLTCPPVGRFRRTVHMLDTTSDPRCKLGAGTATRFFSPITKEHKTLVEGVLCTFSPDLISNSDCSLRRQISCQDGTLSDTQCEVSIADGKVRCVEQGEVTAVRCVQISEYVPDETWKGGCEAIQGPYTRTVFQTEGTDCLPLANGEIAQERELALDPLCTFAFPQASGACGVSVKESCADGEGASHECIANADASLVTCAVTRGACKYEVTLER